MNVPDWPNYTFQVTSDFHGHTGTFYYQARTQHLSEAPLVAEYEWVGKRSRFAEAHSAAHKVLLARLGDLVGKARKAAA